MNQNDVACFMLMAMILEFQKDFENLSLFYMVNQLKGMF